MQPSNPGGVTNTAPTLLSGMPSARAFPPDIRSFPRYPGDSVGGRPSVPGNTASLPAGALAMRPTPSKGGMPSQEFVVGEIVASPWPVQRYERTQAAGAWLFHQRSMHAHEMGVLTLAQINNMLRDWQNIMLSQVGNKAQTTTTVNGGAFEPTESQYKMYVAEYLEKGEMRLLEKDIKEKIFQEEDYRKLAVFSLEHIMNNYRSIGPHSVRDRKGVPANGIVMNVGRKGPTDYQPVTNYWGDVRQGQKCWLLLRRVENSASPGSTDPKDHVFQFVPWYGDANHTPGVAELSYTDVAGIVHIGAAIYCGMVKHTPLSYSNDIERLRMAGLTANQQEAYEAEMLTDKRVVLVIGVPVHRLAVDAN